MGTTARGGDAAQAPFPGREGGGVTRGPSARGRSAGGGPPGGEKNGDPRRLWEAPTGLQGDAGRSPPGPAAQEPPAAGLSADRAPDGDRPGAAGRGAGGGLRRINFPPRGPHRARREGRGPHHGPGSGGDARSGWGRRRPSLRRLLLLAGPGPRPPAPRPSGPSPPPGGGVRRRAPPPGESPQDPAALRPPTRRPLPGPGRPPAAAAAPPRSRPAPPMPGMSGGAGSRRPPRRPRPLTRRLLPSGLFSAAISPPRATSSSSSRPGPRARASYRRRRRPSHPAAAAHPPWPRPAAHALRPLGREAATHSARHQSPRTRGLTTLREERPIRPAHWLVTTQRNEKIGQESTPPPHPLPGKPAFQT